MTTPVVESKEPIETVGAHRLGTHRLVAELHANEPIDADRRILCNVARRLQRKRSVRLSAEPPHLPLCAFMPN